MQPIRFEQATHSVGPPEGMTEAQVQSIPAYVSEIRGGGCDGAKRVVVCWKLDPAEIQYLARTGRLYINFMGYLPPHFVSLEFVKDESIK